jgi:murein DD-endopeptidase MepM/ murein hydrolase activator NlpD
MAPSTRSPSAWPALARPIVASALTLIAVLTCFAGSLGAVLDTARANPGNGQPSAASAPAPASHQADKPPSAPLLAMAVTSSSGAGTASLLRVPATGRSTSDAAQPTGARRTLAPSAADDDGSAEAGGDSDVRTLPVEPGDTLSGLLTRAGVAAEEGLAALEALRPVFNPRSLRAGEAITVTLIADPADGGQLRLLRLAISSDSRHQAVVSRAGDGSFEATAHDLAAGHGLVHAEGTINSSLYTAAARAGVPDTIIVEMIRAFSYEVDFQRDVRPGDRFGLMFEQIRAGDGTVLEAGDLLYARLILGGEVHSLYRHVGADGEAGYYTRDGRSVRTALLRTPVSGARLSSGYGMRRHPVLGFSRMHRGIDFAAPPGTPVYAAGVGRISVIGRNGGYGNYIRIDHGGRFSTAYAHLSRFAPGLTRNSEVMQGQVIGQVGSTGLSTGPHLHYEIFVDDRQVDPLEVKVAGQARLFDRELVRFQATVATIDAQYAERVSGTAIADAAVRN